MAVDETFSRTKKKSHNEKKKVTGELELELELSEKSPKEKKSCIIKSCELMTQSRMLKKYQPVLQLHALENLRTGVQGD